MKKREEVYIVARTNTESSTTTMPKIKSPVAMKLKTDSTTFEIEIESTIVIGFLVGSIIET